MLTKEYITELKENNDVSCLLNPEADNNTLVFVMENLGRLPSEFDGNCFIPFIEHSNEKIRLLAVKNIGKLNNSSSNQDIPFAAGYLYL